MHLPILTRGTLRHAGMTAAASLLLAGIAFAGDRDRGVLVLTSTNDPSANQVLVFQLEPGSVTTLSLVQTLPTGGRGGAGGNAGILQVKGDFGAVANYGSSTVSELVREGDFIQVRGQIRLAPGCVKPVPLPGAPTDLAVAKDRKWLAAVYSANGSGYVAVFAIDPYGDLTRQATSNPLGMAGFNGVAISE